MTVMMKKRLLRTGVVFFSLVLLLAFGCTKPEDDILPEAEWVDLGLPSGLLWAACNVDAYNPEDFGGYFAWGETQPKEVYDGSTYRFYDAESWITKYCNTPVYGGESGYTDTLTILQPCDDAATANLADARTPTPAEWEELINNTKSEWVTLNCVAGRRLIGSNGNSIFLPAAGICNFTSPANGVGRSGVYWTSMLDTVIPREAKASCFLDSEELSVKKANRMFGLSVRPVRATR